MEEMNFCVPCLFGLEGMAARELRHFGCGNVTAENGRVFFTGGPRDLIKANLWLRTGERVLLKIGGGSAESFDELFQLAKSLPWESYIPRDGKFPVTGYCLNSTLHSVPDCQKILKKAIADRLGSAYHKEWLSESGTEYKIRFSIIRNEAELYLDTSGTALHKRGYRAQGSAAPLRETLAAGLIMLADYRGREPFRDCFCGSGTIPIEAAMIACNRAPGRGRRFAAEDWHFLKATLWNEAREEADDVVFHRAYDLKGGDIDPACVALAKENAKKAGVSELVSFEVIDASRFNGMGATGGTLVVNPPYGERLMDQRQAAELARFFGKSVREAGDWKTVVITSDGDYERNFGSRAAKKRKLYNGMIKCDAYLFDASKAKHKDTIKTTK